ncbi:MAG: hypothetical protein H0X47_13840 [Nitrospirales bacterium]|nr:hypothetical protein [Nitrospirales bacterium]
MTRNVLAQVLKHEKEGRSTGSHPEPPAKDLCQVERPGSGRSFDSVRMMPWLQVMEAIGEDLSHVGPSLQSLPGMKRSCAKQR